MTVLDVEVSIAVSRSTRARQLEGSFDVPATDGHTLRWRVDAPLDERPWSVGLIVGPSGSGKSTILRRMFGDTEPLTWGEAGVVDDFPADTSIEAIADVCTAVGFNTIPAWLRPYRVLSNGEQFRVELARRLAAATPERPLALDEWTSVVDRQVARIGSHAAQRYVRRAGLQLVAATCHFDVEDWLQPDWVLEPRASHLGDDPVPSPFRWRSLQRRPGIDIQITPARYEAWHVFAPFHYLTATLNRTARCYVLWARTDDEHEWQPAAFIGCLLRPHAAPKAGAVWGVSRAVTLPDWQGLGLIFVLLESVASAYRTAGCQFHTYPAHPALIGAFDRSPHWTMVSAPKIISTQFGPNSILRTEQNRRQKVSSWRPGARPNATFRYVGSHMESRKDALLLFRCGR
jgi:ABC-type ATPase involved in cell division/GNAT superfamily N-acetyltransferase